MNFVHKFNNIFALYKLSLSYHFLKNFLARCARSRFIPHLEMKAGNVLYQLHLWFFWVIIPD